MSMSPGRAVTATSGPVFRDRYTLGVLRAICRGLGAVLILYLLLFYGIGDVGLLGPDEPRYASIGREMALTGDWITPRLWGHAWFEKPALLYWMIAAGFRAGLDDDHAPRVPVALLSALFLILTFFWLRRQLGGRAAWYSMAILATSAGWFAFSQLGVTDLPLCVTFSAAILLCLPWVQEGNRAVLLPAGICLGVAVLAKGLLPFVLAAPVVWFGRRRLRDVAVFYGFAALTAAPWYVLCTLENGWPFLEEFFWRHHFGRFATAELQHVQPFWFFAPVLIVGLLPWSPLVGGMLRRDLYDDRRVRFLLSIVAFGFLFFSSATNKLPGYLLPLFPPLAVVMGVALARLPRAWLLLSASALALVVVPAAAEVLPVAVARGLSRASLPGFPWAALGGTAVLAAAVAWLDRIGRRPFAVALLTLSAAGAVVYLKSAVYPALEEEVSARKLWHEISGFTDRLCVEDIHRNWRYGLNYYTLDPLPACAVKERTLRLKQRSDGGRPYIAVGR